MLLNVQFWHLGVDVLDDENCIYMNEKKNKAKEGEKTVENVEVVENK